MGPLTAMQRKSGEIGLAESSYGLAAGEMPHAKVIGGTLAVLLELWSVRSQDAATSQV
jgi:hypothetical protein